MNHFAIKICSILHFDIIYYNNNYVSGVSPTNDHDYILTREANYHPDGGQVFYPIDNKPFILYNVPSRCGVISLDLLGRVIARVNFHCGVRLLPKKRTSPVITTAGK